MPRTLPSTCRRICHFKLSTLPLNLLALLSSVPFSLFFLGLTTFLTGPDPDLVSQVPFLSTLTAVQASADVRPILRRDLLALLGLVPVVTLHELLHGLVAWLVGCRPRFGLRWTAGYTTIEEGYFRRGEYVTFAVAPLLGLSLLGLMLVVLAPAWKGPLVLYLVFNSVGSVGDLWIMAQTLRLPAQALVVDLIDGFEAFVLEGREFPH